jgi:hypothetical protein
MPKIIKNAENNITLPQDFLERRHIPARVE